MKKNYPLPSQYNLVAKSYLRIIFFIGLFLFLTFNPGLLLKTNSKRDYRMGVSKINWL